MLSPLLQTLFLLSTFLLVAVSSPGAADSFRAERKKMIGEIEEDVRRTSAYLGKDVLDARVMAAMAGVPRHEFVPPRSRKAAYRNIPLPIGHGQTISQPYIVALMTDLLDVDPDARVLEVGTGSGYQAAILSELVSRVYTMEIIPDLGSQAKKRLADLSYDNVEVRIGDGYYGWPEAAPFDGIVVTAASSHIPPPLIEQLEKGGRMIIPVGSRFVTQQLLLVEKDMNGAITTRQVLPVRFVPLTGGH